MPKRSRTIRNLTLVLVLLAVAVFIVGVAGDLGELMDALRGFRLELLVPILGLAFLNYVVRFVRWQYYLVQLDIHIPLRRSAGIFFAGLMMSVTPGKLGELVKTLMLRDEFDVALTRSAPAVVTERYIDLVAVLALLGLGVWGFPLARGLFIVGVVVAAVVYVVLMLSDTFASRLLGLLGRTALKGRIETGTSEFTSSFRLLLSPARLLVGLPLGMLAWFFECWGFLITLQGLGLADFGLFTATLVYAAGTLAGALSMLPGGLGATEGSFIFMLRALDVPGDIASAATLIIRVCTLWFAVLVGALAYVAQRATVGRALREAEEVSAEDGTGSSEVSS